MEKPKTVKELFERCAEMFKLQGERDDAWEEVLRVHMKKDAEWKKGVDKILKAQERLNDLNAKFIKDHLKEHGIQKSK